MYRELQQLRNRPRQNYNFETSNLYALDYDVENYMTIYEQPTSNPDAALPDSASTHTILTKAEFFHFQNAKS